LAVHFPHLTLVADHVLFAEGVGPVGEGEGLVDVVWARVELVALA